MLYEPYVEMKRDARHGYKFLDSDRTMNVLDWVIFLRSRAYDDVITISIRDPENADASAAVTTINPDDPLSDVLKPYFSKKVSCIIWRLGLSISRMEGNHWIFLFNLFL